MTPKFICVSGDFYLRVDKTLCVEDLFARRYIYLCADTLAARGLEERWNFEELLTESVGRAHFSWLIMFVLEY
jgi:hypothetical protein